MSGIVVEHDAKTAHGTARRAIRLAQAVRIDDLGHLPDWVTPDARGAIVGLSLGGKQRLLMVLATALFLAEREHRPRVDLALVQRAASLQAAAEQGLPAVQTGVLAGRRLWFLALPLAVIAAIVADHAWRALP
jgi:hypothetical protein